MCSVVDSVAVRVRVVCVLVVVVVVIAVRRVLVVGVATVVVTCRSPSDQVSDRSGGALLCDRSIPSGWWGLKKIPGRS